MRSTHATRFSSCNLSRIGEIVCIKHCEFVNHVIYWYTAFALCGVCCADWFDSSVYAGVVAVTFDSLYSGVGRLCSDGHLSSARLIGL